MRKVVQAMTLVTLLLGASWPACAQGVPSAINYQGKLTDSLGQPAPGPQVLTFKLYETQFGGTAFWSRTYNAVPGDGFSVADATRSLMRRRTRSVRFAL